MIYLVDAIYFCFSQPPTMSFIKPNGQVEMVFHPDGSNESMVLQGDLAEALLKNNISLAHVNPPPEVIVDINVFC